MSKLTHVDPKGNPAMVDVSVKQITQRVAVAQSIVELGEEIMAELKDGELYSKKGPVFHTAIIAGTMGAKKTAELIPFCHPVGMEDCKIEITTQGTQAIITCTAKVEAKTGIEMEAITGASIAAITIYDMCKAMSHNIEIRSTRLLEKRGGKKDFKFA
ncbi:MAG: cyclic pyranopterin monophosphate synthase MoaC [Cyclobacteriaceae bacterium]|nr:cyclic pyranopterin monophosphate synthase MoaC [Cyclobacteriaceae bacterium]